MPARLIPFLLLLFTGTICSAMIIPFMAFFLVEGLGRDPWVISVYSFLALTLTISVNRYFAARIDDGARVHPLIGLAAGGYLMASVSIAVAPAFWVVMTLGIIGFGMASSAVSTMFSLGGNLAEDAGVERSRFNAYMRVTTSTAWMIGPAVTFLIADTLGAAAVFKISSVVCLIWLALWWTSLPHDITAPPKPVAGNGVGDAGKALLAAAAFVFCLSFAHSLTFSALPIFYVREVGLPGYAPGTAFSVKTAVEVIAIFSTPMLIARFGLRTPLLVTAVLAVGTTQALAAVTTFPGMIAAAAMEGLYYGLFASIGISFIQSFAPDRPARATALYWNALMVSGLLAGPAVGLIAQRESFEAVIHVASGVAAVAVVVLLVGGRQARRHDPQSPA